MLEELHVRDLALIEEAWLEFGPGMTVLTGETGAGKTALLGALKLLIGERADAGSVRGGAAETLVEGRFTTAAGELLVRRRLSADGRSRCAIGGAMATVGALAERVGPCVDLHGQHEHQALLSATTHLGYLDRWAGTQVAKERAAYRAARNAFKAAQRERDELERALAEAEQRSEYLGFVIRDIDAVAPEAGEDDALEARLPALQHAEKLAQAAAVVSDTLRHENGALDRLSEAATVLSRVAGIDPDLDAIAERIAEMIVVVDDAGTAARQYRDRIAHDPVALDRALDRLAALSGIKKKYGPTLDEVIRTRDEASATLETAQHSEDARNAAQKAADDARRVLEASAAKLTASRFTAVPEFTTLLAAMAGELAMDGAGFEVRFEDLAFESWTEDGPHRVEFLYSPAPGQPARPLAKIASGGEISRVMLALKGVLGEADSVETLVFDEIDAGIGGATAHAVGRRLSQLAASHQVIVVTHLAQVAAYAREHLVVSKQLGEDSVTTSVALVGGDARVAELARMLSGQDSAASRRHAEELLSTCAPAAVETQ